MNTSDVLDQFIIEARECLDNAGQGLLKIERDPDNPELLNDLFRTVHTLKGNCGMFSFAALETVVHAGEDLLDRVRSGAVRYSGDMADALLAAMDLAGELVESIASAGALPPDAEPRAQHHAAALRAFLGARPAAAAGPTAAAPPTEAASRPAWTDGLPANWRQAGRVLLRYEPEPDCFFKGEDPLALVLQTPGLCELQLHEPSDWGPSDTFDCYRCRLSFVLLSDADEATLRQHFRYVPEQVELCAAAPAASDAPAPERAAESTDLARRRVLARQAQIWADQLQVLSRHPAGSSTEHSVRAVLSHLLLAVEPLLGADERARAQGLLAQLQHGHDSAARGGASFSSWLASQRAAAADAPTGTSKPAVAQALRSAEGPLPADDDPAAAGERGSAKVLRVAQEKIDRLMDLIGEMVVAKNALPYLALRAESQYGQRELAREIKNQYAVINRIAEDMQHAIMQVRMLPVGTVFQRFGRLVRDLSKRLGKEVQLVVEGESTEADKNVIETLADPLIHILRNSLDHGIEMPAQRLAAGKPAQGLLRVCARQEGDRVLLDISDDGAGIDPDRVRAKAVERGLIPAERADALSDAEATQLIFLPGFSTAEQVSDLSGRGVGMDVVRSAVERVNGSVSLQSERGRGTQIRLSLPLSMAVTHVMMIRAAGCRFGIPMDGVVETVRVPASDIHHFKQAMTAVLRGRIVPLRALNGLLALPEAPELNAEGEHAVLVLRCGAESVGLIVDDFDGTSDIILRPLDGVLAGITAFAGSALMGDGSVLMVLNPKELL